MTNERAPKREQPLAGDDSGTTSWEFALDRLENPEVPRTRWLATTRPDGRPHPHARDRLLDRWRAACRGGGRESEGAQSRRGRSMRHRNEQHQLPSLDLVVEGRLRRCPPGLERDVRPPAGGRGSADQRRRRRRGDPVRPGARPRDRRPRRRPQRGRALDDRRRHRHRPRPDERGDRRPSDGASRGRAGARSSASSTSPPRSTASSVRSGSSATPASPG